MAARRPETATLSPYPFENFEISDPAASPRFSQSLPPTLQDGIQTDLIELLPIATTFSSLAGEAIDGYIPRSPELVHQHQMLNSRALGSFDTGYLTSRMSASRDHQGRQGQMFTPDATNQNPRSIHSPAANTFASGDIRSTSGSANSGYRELDNSTRETMEAYSNLNIDGTPTFVDDKGGSPWLCLDIVEANGGEYSERYGMQNMLIDDQSVYSSQLRRNVNIILAHHSSSSRMRAPPFWLDEVYIRIPSTGFTAPLKNGFIFVCSDDVSISTFDHYDFIDTTRLLGQGQGDRSLPLVPSCVKTVLFFQLDSKSHVFRYRFQAPIKNVRNIYIKLLDSFGNHDSIDVEFVGFRAIPGPAIFSMSDLPAKKVALLAAAAALILASGIGALYWNNTRKKRSPSGGKDNAPGSSNCIDGDCITVATAARLRGNKYYNAGRFEDALKCYTEAISLYPPTHEDLSLAFSNRAAAHLSLSNYELSLKDCEHGKYHDFANNFVALEFNPKNIKALDRRSRVLHQLGNIEDALVDALAAAAADGFKVESYLMHVEDLLKKLSDVKAKELFEKRKPSLASSWVIRRFIYSFPREWKTLTTSSGDRNELSPFYDQLVGGDYAAALKTIMGIAESQRDSKNVQLYNWLGTMHFLSGKFDAAREAFKIAIMLEPTFVAPRIKLALVAMELGHYTDMTESLEAAERIDDTDASIFYHRAEIFAHKGDLNNAIAALSRAIQLDAEFIDAYVHLGRAYMAMNMIQAASDFIDKALKLFPDSPELLHVRGECFVMESQFDKSLQLFERAIELTPDFVQVYLSKAFIANIIGGTDEQLGQDLEAIVKKFPNCDAAHVQLANHYHMKKNQTDKALRHYDIAIEHSRSYQEVLNIYALRAISSSQAKAIKRYPELAEALQYDPSFAPLIS